MPATARPPSPLSTPPPSPARCAHPGAKPGSQHRYRVVRINPNPHDATNEWAPLTGWLSYEDGLRRLDEIGQGNAAGLPTLLAMLETAKVA